jgi:hypothetical protein
VISPRLPFAICGLAAAFLPLMWMVILDTPRLPRELGTEPTHGSPRPSSWGIVLASDVGAQERSLGYRSLRGFTASRQLGSSARTLRCYSGSESRLRSDPYANRFRVTALTLELAEARIVDAETARKKAEGKDCMTTGCKKDRGSRPVFGKNARAASLRTRQNEACRYSLELAPAISELMASGATSLGQIASGLNAKGIPAPRGGRWRKSQVDRVMQRIGLKNIFSRHPRRDA